MIKSILKKQSNLLILSLSFLLIFALYRNGVKFDTGDSYREVILVMIFLTLNVPLLLFKNKFHRQFHLLFFALILVVFSFIDSEIKNYGVAEVFTFGIFSITSLLAAQVGKDKRNLLNKAIAIIVFVFSVFAIHKYLFQSEPRLIGHIFNPFRPDQGWPNATAFFILMTWPFAVLQLLKSNKRRILWFLISVIILATLYLTYSRGALIALILQILFLLWIYRKEFTKYFKYLILGFVGVALLVNVANYTREQYSLTTHNIEDKAQFENFENTTSVSERLHFYTLSLDLIAEEPILGKGPQTFRYFYPGKQELLYANSDHPHNILLKIAVENGLVTVLVLLVFIISTLFKSNGNSYVRDEYMFLLAALIGAIAHGMVDYNLNFLINLLVFGLIIGQLLSHKEHESKNCYLLLVPFFIVLLGMSIFGAREYSRTEPHPDFSTMLRMNEQDLNLYTNKYGKSKYVRELWLQVSDYYAINNDLEKAENAARKHLQLNPHDRRAWTNLGRVMARQNKEEAVDAFKMAINLDPRNSLSAHYYLLHSQSKLGIDFESSYTDGLLADILESFTYYAENNIHYMSQTSEIEFAEGIYKILKPDNLDDILNSLSEIKEKYRENDQQFNIQL